MPSQLDRTDPDGRRLLAQEMLLMDAQELVVELMEKAGMNRGQLARALRKSNGFVTQLLSGERNMTLRTLADLACATGHRVELRATSIEEPKLYGFNETTALRDSNFEEQLLQTVYTALYAAPGECVQIRETPEHAIPHTRRRPALTQMSSTWCSVP